VGVFLFLCPFVAVALARLRAKPCCYLCAWKPPYSQLGKWTRYISHPSLGNRLEGMGKGNATPLADARHAQAIATSTTTIHASIVMESNQLAVLQP
jgi:hypothetical protein